MPAPIETISPPAKAEKTPPGGFAFGVTAMRLSARQWLIVITLVALVVASVPRIWKAYEPFHPGPDYRIPYALSKDYWLYQRRLDQTSGDNNIYIVGDSVIWGEYVRPDGTLSHFLTEQSPRHDAYLNCGVNGLFPLAMEGLMRNYAQTLQHKKVILHCNLLWMSSPRADLSEPKPQAFNHSRLVPQFMPRIPAYSADSSERISAFLDSHVQFFAWTNHLQIAYFDQHSLPEWTLEDDGSNPPNYPNAYRNPIEVFKSGIPSEPANDPDRGPTSRRHKPWNSGGANPTPFDWVDLDHSLQWNAFQHVVRLLQHRGNDVLIVIGPFNRHMIAPEQRATFDAMIAQVQNWLGQNQVPVVTPDTLPSEMYADASHPLTQGYQELARELLANRTFAKWANRGAGSK